MSVLILSPAAFFMGGTFPVMSHYLVKNKYQQGKITSALYAMNTLGAMLGAFTAGFYLPVLLGFNGSYLFAVCITLLIAFIAWCLSRSEITSVATDEEVTPSAGTPIVKEGYPYILLILISFVSGFSTIGLEVIWTKMFAQVLQNSVYTFSMILVIFLLAISLGAWLTHILIRIFKSATALLFVCTFLSALAVISTPSLFMHMTDNLNYIGGDESWIGYVVSIFLTGSAVILIPGILTGTLFPLVLKLAEPYSDNVGKTVGQLAAVNTFGAILGSVMAGFILFSALGLWKSIGFFAVVYAALLLLITVKITSLNKIVSYAFSVIAIVSVVYLIQQTEKLPTVFIDESKEKLVEVWESNYGTTAVINRGRQLKLKVNNYYTLGGVPTSGFEERQSQIPVLLHSNPENLFYLGMGTGVTAGTSLQYPVKEVIVAELVPEAIIAAEKHFSKYLYGLFEDERATIFAEDGRNFLAGTSNNYDLIISDLFIPWKAGSGTLYTQEHYQTVKDRLEDDGFFVQWMPMYQVSEEEFGIVVRTMLEVFPMVTLWRGGFMTDKAILGIVGHKNAQTINRDQLTQNLQYEAKQFGYSNIIFPVEANMTGYNQFREEIDLISSFMIYYAGNLTQAASVFEQYDINTDNFPLIEYQAPKSHRAEKAKIKKWFVNDDLMRLLNDIHQVSPPETDPYLVNLSPEQKKHVTAGLALHQYEVVKLSGDRNLMVEKLDRFRLIALPDL